MSRLERVFGRSSKSGGGDERKKKVLVAYLCVGDPSPEESIALARTCIEAGADILELGVPFSDPSADGPAIARASQRAIAAGGGLSATLKVAKAIRAESDVPIVLFGYFNPLVVRGVARGAEGGTMRAIAEAADAGVDALLIVDLPVDEAAHVRDQASARGLAVVPLLAPTSSEARVAQIKEASAKWPLGFVYYVSVAGVTGTAALKADEAGARAAELRKTLGLPVVVGFGIDSRDKARAAAATCDGAVVGTAIVKAIEEEKTPEARRARVHALVAELRAGLDS